MTTKARTLFIVSTLVDLPYAASEALWHELAVAARRSGWAVQASVSAVARGSRQAAQLQSHGVGLAYRHFFGGGRGTRYLQRLQDYSVGPWLLSRQLPKSTDLVVVNLGALICAADAPTYQFLKELKAPYVLVVHSNPAIAQYSQKTVSRLRDVLQQAAHTYFVSRRLCDTTRYQLLVDLKKMSVIKNPVNLKSTNILPWPQDEILRMAVVGRLDAWNKGHARLLEVLSREKWRQRDWSVSIFGEGPDEGRIAEAIRFYDLADRVSLRGHVNDIAGEIWASHQVLAMPSLFEGMSLAMVEAMLCGRVVVASDVGGAAELIEHGQTGFIASSPFPAQLDEALEHLWARRGELEPIGARANAAARRYAPADAGQLLLDALGEVAP